MKFNVKEMIHDIANAIVVPLFIFVGSELYLHKITPNPSVLNQLFICPELTIFFIIAVFAICVSVLNHIRWPFILATYAFGGWGAAHIFGYFFSIPVENGAVFGISTLLGAALTTRWKNRFYLIHPKLELPGSIWIALCILLDIAICYGLKEQLFPVGELNVQINFIALGTGITLGVAAPLLAGILKAIIRNESIARVINQIAYRTAQPVALPVAQEQFVQTAPPQVAIHQSAPRSKSTNKLLSRTDLPQSKKPDGPSTKNETINNKPISPSAPEDNWLEKHLSVLNK